VILLVEVYRKLIALFTRPTVNAAQAWKTEEGRVTHAFWMYAAPVHLLLGRDSFFLAAPAPIPMTNEESVAIIDSLNQHFSEMGYYFYILNGVWFLGLDNDPEVMTTPINQVMNENVADYMPVGDGASAWNKLQNEIQMLLFSHPVNQAREAQDLPVINSLWCYGLGKAL
jgi:hypothetical protein